MVGMHTQKKAGKPPSMSISATANATFYSATAVIRNGQDRTVSGIPSVHEHSSFWAAAYHQGGSQIGLRLVDLNGAVDAFSRRFARREPSERLGLERRRCSGRRTGRNDWQTRSAEIRAAYSGHCKTTSLRSCTLLGPSCSCRPAITLESKRESPRPICATEPNAIPNHGWTCIQ